MISELTSIDWSLFHFLRPMLLWLLVPAAMVLLLGLIGLRQQVKWQKVIAPHLRPFVIKKGSEKKLRIIQFGFVFFVAIAIFGAAGPTWNKVELPAKILQTPVVMVLDMSQSMLATDIQPTRLERAKFKIADFLAAKPSARVALVGFAGTAHSIVPLTHDYQIISSHLDGLSPKMMPFQGSNLEDALLLADSITKTTTAPGKIIILTDDFDEASSKHISDYAVNSDNELFILPMNTLSGAQVPGFGRGPMKNSKGEVVYSALNKPSLDKLGSIAGLTISLLTLDNSDMELLAKSIRDTVEFKDKVEEKEDDWIDSGLWFMIPIFLFSLMWFRRGWVIYSMLSLLMLSSCQSNTEFSDLWFTRDYQGQQNFDSENYAQAATLFTDPLRQGVAWYRAGDYEQAIQAFARDTTATGAYNLGLAYYKNGDYALAAMAFELSVELNPAMERAKTNATLAQQMALQFSQAGMADAQEASPQQTAENIANKDPEDLSGGGQEANEEDMKKERKEETASTDIRKGKELDEVPDDIDLSPADQRQKVLMRKVDDDPALFLQRKFAYQVKKRNLKPKNPKIKW